MTPKKTDGILLLGAGGHAKVVLLALRSSGARILGCLDKDAASWGGTVEGVPVLGGDDRLADFPASKVGLVNGIGVARADLGPRRKLYLDLTARGYRFVPVSHASAVVAASARLGAGCQVLTQAVIHPQASIGANAVVNTGAVVEHDARVGDHAFLGPRSVVCGGAVVEDGCFLGTGAVVLPLVRVRAGAVIGAGAVVRREVPAGKLVRGPDSRCLDRTGGLP